MAVMAALCPSSAIGAAEKQEACAGEVNMEGAWAVSEVAETEEWTPARDRRRKNRFVNRSASHGHALWSLASRA